MLFATGATQKDDAPNAAEHAAEGEHAKESPGAKEPEAGTPAAVVAAVPLENKDQESRWKEYDGDGCLVDEESINDLKRAREDLRRQKKEIEAKSTELVARERAIQEELKKIEEMRDQLAVKQVQVKKENEEKVAKLVETVESMNPKSAAALVGGVDESLAVAAMNQLSTAKLAKIMNLMEPSRSARLAESLAGYRSLASAKDSKNQSTKGGE